MDCLDERVAEKFAAFEKQQEPELLQEALEIIETTEQSLPIEDVSARKQGISRWLQFFVFLDRFIDSNWDPEKVPETGLIPPSSDGVVYPSGVDPSAISDPAIRHQYEQALEASKTQANRYRVQLELHRISEDAMAAFQQWMIERYTNSSSDWQEFEEILKKVPVNDVRQAQLRALLSKH